MRKTCCEHVESVLIQCEFTRNLKHLNSENQSL